MVESLLGTGLLVIFIARKRNPKDYLKWEKYNFNLNFL